MQRFLEFLTEGAKHEDDVHDMGQHLSQFLLHLSAPVAHHPSYHSHEELTESGILRDNTLEEGDLKKTPEFSESHPKSHTMIQRGNSEMPEGNLHRRIRDGFAKAYQEMDTEDPHVTQKKHQEARAVWKKFAQDRGLKTSGKILGENGKTKKSSGEGVHTIGLGLAPHSTNGLRGFDVCPRASSECRANCLGTEAGGNKQYPDTSLAGKIRRTHFLALHPEHAARIIDAEIGNHVKKAKSKGMIPGIRMNITSDIPFEKYAPRMMTRHPDAQFYDYTKIHGRVMGQSHDSHPKNYHLTLSHTGSGHGESNDHHVIKALEAGHVVAMVHQRQKQGAPEPTHVEDVQTGKRYPLANGDKDDNTFDRHTTLGKIQGEAGHGVVSALKLKGVKNEDAGHFANKVDDDGVIRINHPKKS